MVPKDISELRAPGCGKHSDGEMCILTEGVAVGLTIAWQDFCKAKISGNIDKRTQYHLLL